MLVALLVVNDGDRLVPRLRDIDHPSPVPASGASRWGLRVRRP